MTRLENYNDNLFEYLDYSLSPEQSIFTADINCCINERKDLDNPSRSVMVIMYKDNPAGFFVLDEGEEKYSATDNKSAIMIRSFSVNPKFQRKGIGKNAMILALDYVQTHFPHINEVVLSVNKRNRNAYNLYIKAGFVDYGTVVPGITGDHHVLCKLLS